MHHQRDAISYIRDQPFRLGEISRQRFLTYRGKSSGSGQPDEISVNPTRRANIHDVRFGRSDECLRILVHGRYAELGRACAERRSVRIGNRDNLGPRRLSTPGTKMVLTDPASANQANTQAPHTLPPDMRNAAVRRLWQFDGPAAIRKVSVKESMPHICQ
jgi:hypothetical protein